jgi:aryl-alcohol dehydrogenase-like predicted oxidoreductase
VHSRFHERPAGQRDRVFLVSKVEANEASGDARLATNFLDLYLLHWPVPNSQFSNVLAGFEQLRTARKIRAWGVSAAPLPKVKARLETLPLVYMAQHTLAEAMRITTAPIAAIRRFRDYGAYSSRANGYGDSKTESVCAHSLVLSLLA